MINSKLWSVLINKDSWFRYKGFRTSCKIQTLERELKTVNNLVAPNMHFTVYGSCSIYGLDLARSPKTPVTKDTLSSISCRATLHTYYHFTDPLMLFRPILKHILNLLKAWCDRRKSLYYCAHKVLIQLVCLVCKTRLINKDWWNYYILEEIKWDSNSIMALVTLQLLDLMLKQSLIRTSSFKCGISVVKRVSG